MRRAIIVVVLVVAAAVVATAVYLVTRSDEAAAQPRPARGSADPKSAAARALSRPLNEFEIRADRPFLFVLAEKATGAPLFMGLVRDPG